MFLQFSLRKRHSKDWPDQINSSSPKWPGTREFGVEQIQKLMIPDVRHLNGEGVVILKYTARQLQRQ